MDKKRLLLQSYNKLLKKKAAKGFTKLPDLCISIKDCGVFGVVNSSSKYPAKTKQKKKKSHVFGLFCFYLALVLNM